MSRLRTVTHLVLCQSMLQAEKGLLGAAARLSAAFLCKESALLKAGVNGPPGIQFRCNLKRKRLVFVHPDIEAKIPGLSALLKCASGLPGSCLKLATQLRNVQKEFTDYKLAKGPQSRPHMQMRAFLPQELHRHCQAGLCCERDAFFEFLCDGVDRDAVCPGE